MLRILYRIVCLLVLAVFITVSVNPCAQAQSVPTPMAALSAPMEPCLMRGMKVDIKEPLKFDFLFDEGAKPLAADAFNDVSMRLIRYFMASLTIPAKDLWVNLSPYENNRIVQDDLGRTAMGRDLLSQDYILKQLSASLLYPDSETGKAFWAKVYASAQEKYGTTDIPVDTFNKVWIVPQSSVVYESLSDDRKSIAAYVDEVRLKVMLESDYVAANAGDSTGHLANIVVPMDGRRGDPLGRPGVDTQDLSKQIIRDIIIPILEKEVNEGANFAPLRQICYSLVLSAWYKKKLAQSAARAAGGELKNGNVLSAVYVDQHKTGGIEIDNPKAETNRIYDEYIQAYKKGAYNLIREEVDLYSQELIPRKYFSGGFDAAQVDNGMKIFNDKKPPIKYQSEWMLKQQRVIFRQKVTKALLKFTAASLVVGAVGYGLWLGGNAAWNWFDSLPKPPPISKLASAGNQAAKVPDGGLEVSSETNKQVDAPEARPVVDLPPSKISPEVKALALKLSTEQTAVSTEMQAKIGTAIDGVAQRVTQWQDGVPIKTNEIIRRMGLSLEDFTAIVLQTKDLMSNFKAAEKEFNIVFSDEERVGQLLGQMYKESSFGLQQVELGGKKTGRGLFQYDKPEYFVEDVKKLNKNELWSALLRMDFPDIYNGNIIDEVKASNMVHDSRFHLIVAMYRLDQLMAGASRDLRDLLQERKKLGTLKKTFPVFEVFYRHQGLKRFLLNEITLQWNVGSRSTIFNHTVFLHSLIVESLGMKSKSDLENIQKYFSGFEGRKRFLWIANKIYTIYGKTTVSDQDFLNGPYFGQALSNLVPAVTVGVAKPVLQENSKWVSEMNKALAQPLKPVRFNGAPGKAMPLKAPSSLLKGSKGVPSKTDLSRQELMKVKETIMNQYKKGKRDRAQQASYGGIDLTAQAENLNIRGEAGVFEMMFSPDQLVKMKDDIDGFVPVVLHTEVVKDVGAYLGFGPMAK